MSSEIPPGTNLCEIPAGVPPPGVTPNLVNPPSLETTTITITTIMMTLGVVFVTLGVWEQRRKLKLRSYFSILSLVLAIGYSITVLLLADKSRHQWDFPVCWFSSSYFKILYAGDMLLGPTIFFAKMSILLLYLEIFSVNKRYRWAIYAGMVFDFLIYWPNIGINSWFNAPHVGQPWSLESIGTRAPTSTIWGLIQGVLAVTIDIYIFILPIPLVMKLKLKPKRKLGVLAIFGTAILGIVASVVALVYRVKEWRAVDETWAYSIVFICVIVEDFVAIVIGVMPSFANYLKATIETIESLSSLRSRLFKSNASSNKDGTANFDIQSSQEEALTFNSAQVGNDWTPKPNSTNSYELDDRSASMPTTS